MPQVLVHGEQNAMGRLRSAMAARYKARDEDVKIHTPRNLETLNLSFRGERVAKVRDFLFVQRVSYHQTGNWNPRGVFAATRRYCNRALGRQRLFIYVARPQRSSRFRWVINLCYYSEAKDCLGVRLESCEMASGRNVWNN